MASSQSALGHAKRKSPRAGSTAASAPVSPNDLARLILAASHDGRNLDAWRSELVSALTELQQRRQADKNRAAGIAKRTARDRNLRADIALSDAGGCTFRRDSAMQKARDAKALGLPADVIAGAVRGHVINARAANHGAIRLRRQAQQLREAGKAVSR
jgi:hypothetical protein